MALFDNIFAGENGLASLLLNTMGISGVVFNHKIEGEYDPRTDTMSDEQIVSKTVTTSPILKFTTDEIAKLDISVEDCKLIGKGTDFEEVTDKVDTVVISGVTYMIISHKKACTGDSVGIVILQLRKQG